MGTGVGMFRVREQTNSRPLENGEIWTKESGAREGRRVIWKPGRKKDEWGRWKGMFTERGIVCVSV